MSDAMWSQLATSAPVAAEPDRSSTVWALVALLVVLGIALVMLAVWMVRMTRPDPEVLAPLERMSDRAWRNTDPVWQRRELDELRPEGAEPFERMAAPPDLDEQFDEGPQAPGFDDLRGDQVLVGGDGEAGAEPEERPADELVDASRAGANDAPEDQEMQSDRPA